MELLISQGIECYLRRMRILTRNIVGVQQNEWMNENNGKSLGLVLIRSVCENITLSLISQYDFGQITLGF